MDFTATNTTTKEVVHLVEEHWSTEVLGFVMLKACANLSKCEVMLF